MAMKRFSGLFSSRKTPFQILSDLHLNHESQYLTFHIPATAPYLILAGNIGRLLDYDAYLSFLIRRSQLYTKVFLVLGSLEYHGITLQEGQDLARKLESEERLKGKLVLLDRKRHDIQGTGVLLLGCTLWSQIPKTDMEAVLKKTPEFDANTGIKNWSVRAHNAAHEADLTWLRGAVADPASVASGPSHSHTFDAYTSISSSSASEPERRTMVITSFAPELKDAVAPWQVDSPWVSAYGTELLRGNDWNGVKLWIHGATGKTGTFKTFGVKVASNQRGVKGEEDKGLLKDGLAEKEKQGEFDVERVVKV